MHWDQGIPVPTKGNIAIAPRYMHSCISLTLDPLQIVFTTKVPDSLDAPGHSGPKGIDMTDVPGALTDPSGADITREQPSTNETVSHDMTNEQWTIVRPTLEVPDGAAAAPVELQTTPTKVDGDAPPCSQDENHNVDERVASLFRPEYRRALENHIPGKSALTKAMNIIRLNLRRQGCTSDWKGIDLLDAAGLVRNDNLVQSVSYMDEHGWVGRSIFSLLERYIRMSARATSPCRVPLLGDTAEPGGEVSVE